VLLGSRFHGVFPGHAVADTLDRHFLLHDFTPAALRKGLQVPIVRPATAKPNPNPNPDPTPNPNLFRTLLQRNVAVAKICEPADNRTTL